MSSYLDYIRSLPCARCRAPAPSDAHHIVDMGLLPGMGRKAPDALAMPLCRVCHGVVHSGETEDQGRFLAWTIDQAVRDGWMIKRC